MISFRLTVAKHRLTSNGQYSPQNFPNVFTATRLSAQLYQIILRSREKKTFEKNDVKKVTPPPGPLIGPFGVQGCRAAVGRVHMRQSGQFCFVAQPSGSGLSAQLSRYFAAKQQFLCSIHIFLISTDNAEPATVSVLRSCNPF